MGRHGAFYKAVNIGEMPNKNFGIVSIAYNAALTAHNDGNGITGASFPNTV